MPANTPIYGLPYLVGSDGGKRIKEVSEALALKLDATLAQTGNPPLDSDLVSLLQRLGALESALSAAEAKLLSIPKDFSGIKGPIPSNARVLTKRGFATLTLASNGTAAMNWPEAFPTEIAGFHATTIEGSGVTPVVNGNNITRTGVNLYFNGAGAGTAKISWTAWGY